MRFNISQVGGLYTYLKLKAFSQKHDILCIEFSVAYHSNQFNDRRNSQTGVIYKKHD